MCLLLRGTRRTVLQNQNQLYHFSQLLASQSLASLLLPSQLLAQFQCSRQLTQVHLCLEQAREQLEQLDFPNDLMIMNCQRHDWTLLLVERLTAVPCLSCYGTELNFCIQYLSLRSHFILDISLSSKKKTKEGCSVIKADV